MHLYTNNCATALEPKRILITGARAPHALHLARTLRAKGHTIFTAETSHFHISRFSNAVEKNYIIPSPRYEREKFFTQLIHIINEAKIDLLIPTWEETLYISEERHRFPKACTIFCSDFELVHQLHNKWLFQLLVKKNHLLAPNSQIIQSKEDFEKVTVKKPFALKSSYSRAGQCIYKIEENTPCPSIQFDPGNPWIAQEWVYGEKYCSYSIAHEGTVTAHAAYPVRFAIDKNSCISFEAIEHKGIEQWVKDLVRATRFTGQIAFDFIQDSEGKIFAIECNPRSTSGLYLFGKETAIDRAFFNRTEELVIPARPTRKQIAGGMLMYGWRDIHQNTGCDSFLRTFMSYEDVVFNRLDPTPFISQAWLYFYYIWKSHQLNLTIPAFFTHDLDWNGKSS